MSSARAITGQVIYWTQQGFSQGLEVFKWVCFSALQNDGSGLLTRSASFALLAKAYFWLLQVAALNAAQTVEAVSGCMAGDLDRSLYAESGGRRHSYVNTHGDEQDDPLLAYLNRRGLTAADLLGQGGTVQR